MPPPVEIIKGIKTFSVLENNPEVMNSLAHTLGLSPTLSFHDIYSLDDPTHLSHIPRPCLAMLCILPLTPTWGASRTSEDANRPPYEYPIPGTTEPVLWFKQTIGHACGSIGLLHCVLNGPSREYILPDSTLSRLREAAIPLGMEDRARLLYDSKELEEAHQGVAEMGDTGVVDAAGGDKLGHHFVAFVKGDDGTLWELEGGRRGPLKRGMLGEGEDMLSERALGWGVGRVLEMERGAGGADLRFSCIALAARGDLAGEEEEVTAT